MRYNPAHAATLFLGLALYASAQTPSHWAGCGASFADPGFRAGARSPQAPVVASQGLNSFSFYQFLPNGNHPPTVATNSGLSLFLRSWKIGRRPCSSTASGRRCGGDFNSNHVQPGGRRGVALWRSVKRLEPRRLARSRTKSRAAELDSRGGVGMVSPAQIQAAAETVNELTAEARAACSKQWHAAELLSYDNRTPREQQLMNQCYLIGLFAGGTREHQATGISGGIALGIFGTAFVGAVVATVQAGQIPATWPDVPSCVLPRGPSRSNGGVRLDQTQKPLGRSCNRRGRFPEP